MIENKKKTRAWVGWWITAIVMVALALVIAVVFRTEETYVSGGETTVNISSVECVSSTAETLLFDSKDAQRVENEIKMTFKSDYLDNISYNYTGTFNNNESAEVMKSNFHANYNMYMGKNNVDPEILNPIFADIKTKVNISLYVARDKMNQVIADLFFLTADDIARKEDFTASKLKKIYESKGFTCKNN